jgi:hypothetical protein
VFAGWVELLHAISTLLGGRAGTLPGAEDDAAGTARTRSEDAR